LNFTPEYCVPGYFFEEVHDFIQKSFEEMHYFGNKNLEEMQKWYYT
jgi:hypothetical protein